MYLDTQLETNRQINCKQAIVKIATLIATLRNYLIFLFLLLAFILLLML